MPIAPALHSQLAQRLTVSIIDAAQRLGISRAHLYAEIKRGRIRTVKLGGRRLIRVVDLYAYLESNIDDAEAPGDCSQNDAKP